MKGLIIIALILFPTFLYGQDTLRHSVEVGSRYEDFIDRETYRVFTYFQYGYKIKGKHDLMGRFVHQNRNGENAMQYVVDYYPQHKHGYMWFSGAYSNSILFPKITLIGEYYRSVGKQFETSLGVRYLKPLDGYNIYVLTGTWGVYVGNWYMYARPMLNFLDDGVGWSGSFTARKYFGDKKMYVEAIVLRGQDAGTTRPVGSIENSFGLDTYLLRLKGNIPLPKNFTLSVGGDYSGIFIPKANGDKTEINIGAVDLTLKKVF